VLAPWAGAKIEVHLDSEFTKLAASFAFPGSASQATPYYGRSFHAFNNDVQGDNTYFWRVQPRYKVGNTLLNGVWSQGWRFERQGFVPENLVPENLADPLIFVTPTFSWDMVEGAQYYDLQVDDDPNFKSPAISISTRQNSYTGISTLANGTYYWRVRVGRYGSVINDWSASRFFTLSLPQPDLLSPTPNQVVKRAPTFCWAPILEIDPSGDPVLAAWKYRIQISQEPSFSKNFDTADTEQTCWTPTKGYDEGTYYWRVAMMDGNNKLGDYSDIISFTKQYPVTELISPISGENVKGTPTFIWKPVNGAASYRLEVSFYTTFSPTIDAITTHNARFTPIKVYTLNQSYYWRVAIIDADGKYGPWVGSQIIDEDTYEFQIFLPLINK
jgi:hypothetical protein